MNCNCSFSDAVQKLHSTSDSKLVATSVGIICKSKIFRKTWFLNVWTKDCVCNCETECGRSGDVIGCTTAVGTPYVAQLALRVDAGAAAGAVQSTTVLA